MSGLAGDDRFLKERRGWKDRRGGQREFLVLDPHGHLAEVAQRPGGRPGLSGGGGSLKLGASSNQSLLPARFGDFDQAWNAKAEQAYAVHRSLFQSVTGALCAPPDEPVISSHEFPDVFPREPSQLGRLKHSLT